MRVAIMQPYFLPYIGYWRLVASVDKFVLLDDVNYIKRGWINRNRILVNAVPFWLTLPLKKASQNRLIFEIDVVDKLEWQPGLEKTVQHAYAHAPNFQEAFEVFQKILNDSEENLSASLAKSILIISRLLGIKTEIFPTSRIFPKNQLTGQTRIIDICKRLGATEYLNASGGRELYDPLAFRKAGIRLCFLSEQGAEAENKSESPDGKPLSILDNLMNHSLKQISKKILEK